MKFEDEQKQGFEKKIKRKYIRGEKKEKKMHFLIKGYGILYGYEETIFFIIKKKKSF